jgi:hypothetical protein
MKSCRAYSNNQQSRFRNEAAFLLSFLYSKVVDTKRLNQTLRLFRQAQVEDRSHPHAEPVETSI